MDIRRTSDREPACPMETAESRLRSEERRWRLLLLLAELRAAALMLLLMS